MWLKLIPIKIWIWAAGIFLLIVLGFLSMAFWQLKTEKDGLENSISFLEAKMVKTKEENRVQFDSLQKVILIQDGNIDKLQQQIPGILHKIKTVNHEQQQKKQHLLRITSVDSLTAFFTKRYKPNR